MKAPCKIKYIYIYGTAVISYKWGKNYEEDLQQKWKFCDEAQETTFKVTTQDYGEGNEG